VKNSKCKEEIVENSSLSLSLILSKIEKVEHHIMKKSINLLFEDFGLEVVSIS